MNTILLLVVCIFVGIQGDLSCGNATYSFFTEDQGVITFGKNQPEYRFQYSKTGFWISCNLESVAELNENSEPMVEYGLSDVQFEPFCDAPQLGNPFLPTSTLLLTGKLLNSATIEARFIQWGSNTSKIVLGPSHELILHNDTSFEMDVSIINWPVSMEKRPIRINAVLATSASFLEFYAGYYKNGDLKELEVNSPHDNLAFTVSNMASRTINNQTDFVEMRLQTQKVSNGPLTGRLSMVIPVEKTEMTDWTVKALVRFEVRHILPNKVIALSVGIVGGLLLLACISGAGFFFLWKRYPEMWGRRANAIQLQDMNEEK